MVSEEETQGEEIRQRIRNKCPNVCPLFKCELLGNCKEECKTKLDLAKALICEICEEDCSPKKQIALLDSHYFQQKQKLFSEKHRENIEKLKGEHDYWERRHRELTKKLLVTKWYNFFTKLEIVKEGNQVVNELVSIRKHMDILEIPYKKEIDLENKKKNN